MRIRLAIIIFVVFLLSSCIKHQLSSNEIDDVYFTKKDIIKVEEGSEDTNEVIE